ncbi:DUF6530 family protein [uncultured Marinococcus sp.]|uniref:DUF6530 family protein n=1 Tax=uncultured Marinococcus sp. TaxID=487012 RepID=UPI00261F4015|nr:DUF6530 family protein [uncultured Marinococcus sp.]
MQLPVHLKHRPILTVENHDHNDGKYAPHSDAKGLSLGLAQWMNPRIGQDISAKMWRYTGNRWSRQSEELPIHRVLDLSILICEMKIHLNNQDQEPLEKEIDLGLNQYMKIKKCSNNEQFQEDKETFAQVFQQDKHLEGRLTALRKSLEKAGY